MTVKYNTIPGQPLTDAQKEEIRRAKEITPQFDYDERTIGGAFGLVVTEHHFVSPEGRASAKQLSIVDDSKIEDKTYCEMFF